MDPALVLEKLALLKVAFSRELEEKSDSGLHFVNPEFLRATLKAMGEAAEVIKELNKPKGFDVDYSRMQ